MTHRPLTVGDLRAELVGWPDDAVLTVAVPDRSAPTMVAMLPVVAAGYGPDLETGSDPVLTERFPLTAAWHDSCDGVGAETRRDR